MNIFYKLLKANRLIKNHTIKFLGVWFLHVTRKRHLYVNLDPVLLCNLKCRMCYFSDPNNPKASSEKMTTKDAERIASLIFKQTLKLQVGCGAEPTVSKNYIEIIEIAKKKYSVPLVSLTTNANLLNEKSILRLIESGLDEITISLHGVHKEKYEYFMQNASYEKFLNNIRTIDKLKKEKKSATPHIRINYTVNSDNLDDISDFYDVFGDVNITTLQVRPIREIGNSDYNNFSIDERLDDFIKIRKKLITQSKLHNVTFLSPDLESLTSENTDNSSSIITDSVYRYISPLVFWEKDFDWKNQTYFQYCKKRKWAKYLLKSAFTRKKKLEMSKEHLNYDVL